MNLKIIGQRPGTPLWIGAGLMVLAPVVAPAVSAASKAIAKAALIGGLQAYRILKATSMAAADAAVDLYEEAKAELDESTARTDA